MESLWLLPLLGGLAVSIVVSELCGRNSQQIWLSHL
jgi:hypothetical protein